MMSNSAVERDQQQRRVAAYFDAHALHWKTIYERPGLYETIHQQRRTRVLGLIDGLALPAGSTVLETGCGAGSIAVALAVRGHFVQATDFVETMVSFTRRLAVEAKVEDRVRTSVADIRDLKFPDHTVDLVVALGVLPWIQPPLDPSVREIARVLKPGGHMVANIDNRWRLNHILDPFVGGRRLLGKTIRRLGIARTAASACAHTCSPRHFDTLLRAAGLAKLQSFTLGFGPFSLLSREVVPEPLGLKLHSKLQSLADDGFPLIRACGSQYIVLARKGQS
jgi:ubiquinone/menaquinone biosynthesis C-methylase UbiE